MLAKKFRFHGYGSLKFAYAKGKVVRARYLNLKFVKNNRRADSRLAIVVSKKITKKAPARNRMRRRLYEAFRQEWPMIQPGYDLVVTVFDERVATVDSETLGQLVHELLEQSRLYK